MIAYGSNFMHTAVEEETLALVSEGGAVGLVDKLGSLELIAEAIRRL
jgi:hypothetical protein